MISYLLSFVFFAFLASITPGPTNIIAFGIGMHAHTRKSIAFVLASSASASLILFVTFFGIARVLLDHPFLQTLMTISATIWLSWMAYKLFQASEINTSSEGNLPDWQDGALLQVINPKVWMMALTVSSLFLYPAWETTINAAWLALIFFMVTCPCMGTWALLGRLTRHSTENRVSPQTINRILAVLLLLTVWGVALQSALT